MFAEKVIVAFVSSVTFSLLLVLLFFLQAGPDTGWNFLSLFVIYFIYSAPIYLIGGSLYSAFVDVFIELERYENKYLRYIIGFAAYTVGGVVIVGIWLLIMTSGWNEMWRNFTGMAIAGIFAALLYFHIVLAWRKILDYR